MEELTSDNDQSTVDQYLLKNYPDLINCLAKLKDLSECYYSEVMDLHTLESFKREFLGNLQYFTELSARVKAKKAGSFGFLDEDRKRIKSEIVEFLVSEGNKVTTAEKLVYSDSRYKSRYKSLSQTREFYIKIEDLHKHFYRVLDSVVQSISVAAKERV